ncbi:fhypothetical protein [Blastocystis sp. subtype 4]|uniref:fhypothetical protein n=1 Tax=Blastocystis sp. subtype 4 TaxID=944170 RepID=UPI0007118D4B|nr:fhypothetical protein [Blastocystis sp. subtype 4]KNB42103.1 fhypothetical protein [Blastocystis sp. subtype 4]|eukprot:XP_014525546.1 fhypothetical protein [Blastocystis sp. subtype 4]
MYCLNSGWEYSYKEKFRIVTSDDYTGITTTNLQGKQPPAILQVKNGDNEEELILVTTNLYLRIYQFSHESVSIYKNSHESSYKEVSLLSSTQLRSSTSIIAMKAQRIHIQNDVFGVIAILSNNGIISCYDESLRLLWKVSIYESSLLNMSNLIVSNSALSIEQQDGIPVLYVVISYSMSRKHLIKGLNERLTEEEIEVLRKNQIAVGNDVDLSKHKSNPYLYILEKYKSIYDKLISINELKVLQLNVENGDILWRNSILPHPKRSLYYHQQQPVLNRFDSEQKYLDISDFSQSVILYFPHFYHSYQDSHISTQPHYRNEYHNQGNYLDSPLRSLLPLDLFSTLLHNIHKRHILLQKSLETVKWGNDNRVVVVHYDMGIMLLDCSTGRHISDLPLMSNQLHAATSYHLNDIVSVFLTPQPFTGDNDVPGSFSRCYLQAVSMNTVLFSTNICGSSKSRQNEDDEILILQPLLILGEDSIIEAIVTLTSEGVLTSTNIQGEIQWSKSIHVQWSEFDEKSGLQPFMVFVKGMICVSDSKSTVYYSKKGRTLSKIEMTEPLIYPVHPGSEEDSMHIIFQSSHNVIVYELSTMKCILKS